MSNNFTDNMFDEKVQSRPAHKEKILDLHAMYVKYKSEGMATNSRASPWTKEAAVALGVLYVQAWGHMPTSRHMNPMYGMIHARQIQKLFGNFDLYYAAIQGSIDELLQ